MIPSLMALLHLGCTPLSKCTRQGHPTNIIANQMLLYRHPTFCPMWKDRGWITALLKSILLSGNLKPSFVSEQLPPGKNSGKRPFQSEVQPPRKQKRRRTPPSASANPPGYSQAGENQSNPDLASRTCNDCGQILSSTYNYQRHVADRK